MGRKYIKYLSFFLTAVLGFSLIAGTALYIDKLFENSDYVVIIMMMLLGIVLVFFTIIMVSKEETKSYRDVRQEIEVLKREVEKLKGQKSEL